MLYTTGWNCEVLGPRENGMNTPLEVDCIGFGVQYVSM